MRHRGLEALGLDGVAALEPLTYPGRPVHAPSLLSDGTIQELAPGDGRLGSWPVAPVASTQTLDSVLRGLGLPVADERYPVLAVGSNASPGQLRHKLVRAGVCDTVPMVPVRVRGVAVALSGHISPPGYVSASPYADGDAETTLVAGWLDPAQLAAVDRSERANFRRAFLPGAEYPVFLPSGRRLGGAHLYENVHGVLTRRDGAPRPCGDQPAVLAGLLTESPRLRQLLGPEPEDWIRRAGTDPEVRARGAAVFREEGWLAPRRDFTPHRVAAASGEGPRYGDLAS